jgi:hypothetical protein
MPESTTGYKQFLHGEWWRSAWRSPRILVQADSVAPRSNNAYAKSWWPGCRWIFQGSKGEYLLFGLAADKKMAVAKSNLSVWKISENVFRDARHQGSAILVDSLA